MKKIVLSILLFIPLSVMAAEWPGIVVGISDGDTVQVLDAQQHTVKIRLAEIDAPEKKQAFGTQAKQSLSDLCFNKPVVVDDRGTDRYRRTVGRITCNGIDANAEQVKRGMAWAYRQYLKDPGIVVLEQTAKAGHIGLWSDANQTPPWEFRRKRK